MTQTKEATPNSTLEMERDTIYIMADGPALNSLKSDMSIHYGLYPVSLTTEHIGAILQGRKLVIYLGEYSVLIGFGHDTD